MELTNWKLKKYYLDLKLNNQKIQDLCKEINFHDAALLEKVLQDTNKTINWTEKQKERIEKIKQKHLLLSKVKVCG